MAKRAANSCERSRNQRIDCMLIVGEPTADSKGAFRQQDGRLVGEKRGFRTDVTGGFHRLLAETQIVVFGPRTPAPLAPILH